MHELEHAGEHRDGHGVIYVVLKVWEYVPGTEIQIVMKAWCWKQGK